MIQTEFPRAAPVEPEISRPLFRREFIELQVGQIIGGSVNGTERVFGNPGLESRLPAELHRDRLKAELRT